MQKEPCTSALVKGIIEEININKITKGPITYRVLDNEKIHELALSIKQHGLLNPIILRVQNERFEIVSGILRFEACKKLGWRKILSHVVEIDKKEALEMYLVENLQRKSLDPLMEARAFKTYLSEVGWGGISELSLKISKSCSYISKRLSMLELPEDLLNNLIQSNVNTSIIEELTFIKDPVKQIRLAKYAMAEGLTVREIRNILKKDETVYDFDSYLFNSYSGKDDSFNSLTLRSFDKTIVALKIAMSKIGEVINSVEDNWVIYEILLQHKNMLNDQINILIKEKKKL